MKVLADTSVWIDHLHTADEELRRLLRTGEICVHPVVIGELACGSIKNRGQFLAQLLHLPLLREAPFLTALRLIQSDQLWARGLGWSDVQILVSCQIEKAELWTRDLALRKAAKDIGITQAER